MMRSREQDIRRITVIGALINIILTIFKIIATTSAIKGVEDIHELKTRRNGISYIIDAHLVVNPHISVTQAHNIATDVENALREKYGKETQINIHIEPDKESL